MRRFRLICADVFEGLARLPDESVHCVITSPPYWRLRDYGTDGQLGLEATPEEYVETMTGVFREVRRVLRSDGTLWLNMGDCYASGGYGARDPERWPKQSRNDHMRHARAPSGGLKPKDLVGMPWRLAFALQSDGWWLRQDNIWQKRSPMPESVRDRTTRSHEYLFHLSKSQRYYYDAKAIREPVTGNAHARGDGVNPKARVPSGWDTGPGNHKARRGRYPRSKQNESFSGAVNELVSDRNKRSVWTIASEPFPDAHFATFPTKLVEPCVLAGCPEGGVVLDPFCGSGTTGVVALRADRRFVGIELNPEYVQMARRRIGDDAPLLNREDPMLLELAA